MHETKPSGSSTLVEIDATKAVLLAILRKKIYFLKEGDLEQVVCVLPIQKAVPSKFLLS